MRITQVLENSKLTLIHEEGINKFYSFKPTCRSNSRTYIVELSYSQITRYIIYIVKDQRITYISDTKSANQIETLIESYYATEGQLSWKFPYGNLGVDNQVSKWFELENNRVKIKYHNLATELIKKYIQWLRIDLYM